MGNANDKHQPVLPRESRSARGADGSIAGRQRAARAVHSGNGALAAIRRQSHRAGDGIQLSAGKYKTFKLIEVMGDRLRQAVEFLKEVDGLEKLDRQHARGQMNSRSKAIKARFDLGRLHGNAELGRQKMLP